MTQKTKSLVLGAATAALYTLLTYLASLLNLAYGPVQFRISEAMTLLPVLTPAAVPGLIIGCFLSNLWSPLGVVDLLFGTLATGLSAIWSRSLRRYRLKGLQVLSALPPVVCNAVIVGLEIACLSDAGFSLQSFSWVAFFSSAASVGLGELVICLVLGVPLVTVLERSGAAKRIFEG